MPNKRTKSKTKKELESLRFAIFKKLELMEKKEQHRYDAALLTIELDDTSTED